MQGYDVIHFNTALNAFVDAREVQALMYLVAARGDCGQIRVNSGSPSLEETQEKIKGHGFSLFRPFKSINAN